MEIPLVVLILQGIPEGISVLTLAYVISNIRLKWKDVFIGGVILSGSSFLLRLLPISFGVHTVIVVLLLIFLIIKFGKVQNLSSAIMASLISMLSLIITEIMCLTVLMSVLGLSEQDFLTDLKLRILLPLPQVLLMFILAFVIYKLRKNRGESLKL